MKGILLWAISVAALVLGVINFQKQGRVPTASSSTDAYTSVVQTGEIRAGYLVYPPYLTKDTSSGKLAGIFYDVTEALGKNLGLKIKWVEEVNLANLAEGFKSNRYDMVAFPLWRNAGRAKVVDFSVPLFYSVVGAYVKHDDKRFDGKLVSINSPEIRIAAIDGELAADIAKTSFPKAKIESKPQLAAYEQLLLEVIAGKADVTFFNRLFANRFIAANPNKVRDVSPQTSPIRLYAECFILPLGEHRFNSMINSALVELVENGGFDTALSNHGEKPEDYFRRALPFRPPGQ